MRKYLGVLAGVAALCVTSWAQAPAQAPPSAQDPAQAQTPAQPPAPELADIPAPTAANPAPPVQYPRIEFFGRLRLDGFAGPAPLVQQPGEALVIDVEEERAVRTLARAGLVPRLRHRAANT